MKSVTPDNTFCLETTCSSDFRIPSQNKLIKIHTYTCFLPFSHCGSIEYRSLYDNQISARALIGQSAMGYCAGKAMEKSLFF